jgi:hypothetical protein
MSNLVRVRVEGFLPSQHGFRFSNEFPPGPVVRVRLLGLGSVPFGDATRGLCGGMAFAVRDWFDTGRPIPDRKEPPIPGSELFNYLVRRLWDSFHLPGGPFRYYAWMRLDDDAIFRRTLTDGWPRIRDELDRGRLAALGFNRYRSRNPLALGDNHQILAFGYDRDRSSGEFTLHVYDSNYPLDDELTIRVRPAARTIEYSTGETVRGFFHTPYRPPGFAWCSYLFGLH